MKKHAVLVLIIALILTAIKAFPQSNITSKSNSDRDNYIILSPDPLTFPYSGGTDSIFVLSNVNWTVTEGASWLIVSPMGGSDNDTLYVTCLQNTTPNPRIDIIIVSGPSVADTVTVIQPQAPESYLIVDPDNSTVVASGGSITANVKSNINWNATESETWITLSVSGGNGNGSFNITCSSNTGANSRSGIVTVSGTGVPNETINVFQYGQGQPFLIVDPDNQSVIATGGTYTASVKSNLNWTVTETEPWITLSVSSGNGYGNFNFTCQPHTGAESRSGTITINAPGVANETINVFQYGQGQAFLVVDPDNQSVVATGGTISASVKSNLNWVVTETEPWITLSQSNGYGYGNFDITCTANTDPDSRSAVVTISASGVPDEFINIFQYGQGQAFLIVDPDNKSAIASGETFTAIVKSNLAWDVIENAPWITLSANSGNGNDNFNITCSPNPDPDSRNSIITITADGVPDEIINVLQYGQGQSYMIVDPDNLPVLVTGGSYTGTVKSNVNWNVTDNGDWIHLLSNSGNGNGSFNFICEPNTLANSRTAVITVTATDLPDETINVVQYGQGQSYLIVDPNNPTVLAAGGNFIATVYSNVDWSVTDDQPWIKIETSRGRDISTFNVICDPNEEATSRVGHVVVSGPGVSSETIEITQFGQSGNFLHVSPIAPNVSYTSGNIEFEVTSNVDWQVSENSDWITNVVPSSGTGSQSFKAYYDENPLGEIRQAVIQVLSGDLLVNIYINQDGNSVTISLKGKIKDGFNVGIEGVDVLFISQLGTKKIVTPASGDYEIILPSGRWGSLRPEKEGMVFTPPQMEFNDPIVTNLENLNFTGGALSQLNLTFNEYVITICQGDEETLEPVISGATTSATYTWTSSPPGFTSTSKNPIVSPSVDTYYILEVDDILGQVTDSVLVIPKDLPVAKNISGLTQVCRNQAGLTYQVESYSANETYSWLLNSGGSIIYGTGNISAVVNWGDDTGIYDLILNTVNQYGCASSKSISVQVTDYIAPPSTEVEKKNTDISCILICMDTTADYYRWGYTDPLTLEDHLLDNKTDRFCEIPVLCEDLQFNYWVETWYTTSSCVSRSYYNYTPPVGTDDLSVESNITIFPNPVHDQLNLLLNDPAPGKLELCLYNSVGMLVLQEKLTKPNGELSVRLQLPDLDPGFYFLVITTPDFQYSKKLVIL